MRTVAVVAAAAAVVDADYYVGLVVVDCVAVVAGVADAEAVVVVVDVTVVAVVGARQLPQSGVGVAVAADDGPADVGAVAVAGVHQSDRATDVPGAGLVT